MNTDFLAIAQAHRARYPLMEAQDFGKLAYQSEFGPSHLRQSGQVSQERIFAAILSEMEEANPTSRPPEPVGNGLCRFHLTKDLSPVRVLPLVGRLLLRTMWNVEGTDGGLQAKLDQLRTLNIPGWTDWVAKYRRQGCPVIRHSESFRSAYHPHYRVLRLDYAGFLPVLLPLEELARKGRPAVAAVDGRCGSGKTSFAALADVVPGGCNVVHMDDFYLPPDRRRPDWQEVPGGNMDLTRLRDEVLLPLRRGGPAVYRPFDCQTGQFGAPVELEPDGLTLVEGSYSLHPLLAEYYDEKFFLTCSREKQAARLRQREGNYFPAFEERWIPLEEHYFAQCGPERSSSLVVDTTDFF